ncbi:MAG TPA: hydrogenase expression/formation protein HypE [Thermoprotei archaeon]|nr:hydrogenase expression/formation protein HypE [Thermoprotei archaeon]
MGKITLAHGAGGRESSELIEKLFSKKFRKVSLFNGIGLRELDDGATIPLKNISKYSLVISSDSYTVDPLFFPGGNIGTLAVTGSINDVAVMGGKPIGMLDTIVVEEGFPINILEKIVDSMKNVLENEDVALIGGDLKVMPRGKIDKIVISTTCIGLASKIITDCGLKPGDKIIISGTIGEHGITILAMQMGVEIEESGLKSDIESVVRIMDIALKNGGIHAAKDPTRGGLAQALNEFASKNNLGIFLKEELIPIREEVRSYSEILGIDPLTLACEGRVVLGVNGETAETIVEELHRNGFKDACIIGEVRKERKGLVLMETITGGLRLVERPIGEIVPRIC